MVLKILVIGDIGNYFQTIRKYVKKSKIHIINFPKDGFGEFTYDDDYVNLGWIPGGEAVIQGLTSNIRVKYKSERYNYYNFAPRIHLWFINN